MAVPGDPSGLLPVQPDVHWIWRNEMVNTIAEKLDFEKFGIEAFYLIGSTKNATSGPGSDIDILIHFAGNEVQKNELKAWFETVPHPRGGPKQKTVEPSSVQSSSLN